MAQWLLYLWLARTRAAELLTSAAEERGRVSLMWNQPLGATPNPDPIMPLGKTARQMLEGHRLSRPTFSEQIRHQLASEYFMGFLSINSSAVTGVVPGCGFGVECRGLADVLFCFRIGLSRGRQVFPHLRTKSIGIGRSADSEPCFDSGAVCGSGCYWGPTLRLSCKWAMSSGLRYVSRVNGSNLIASSTLW